MSQGPKLTGGRVVPGDGADAGDALLQIDSQLGPGVRGGDGHGNFHFLAAPADEQGGDVPGGIQNAANLLGVMHIFTVDFYNPISDFQSGVFGLGSQRVVKGGNGYGIVPQLQPYGLSHRHQQRLCQG